MINPTLYLSARVSNADEGKKRTIKINVTNVVVVRVRMGKAECTGIQDAAVEWKAAKLVGEVERELLVLAHQIERVLQINDENIESVERRVEKLMDPT